VTASNIIMVEPLTPERFAPFGWLIGMKPEANDPALFGNDITKWRTAHDFNPGQGGVTEFVWVNYGRKPLVVDKLESHRLTEQSFIPLGGSVPIIHVLAPPPEDPMAADIRPDMSKARAFLLEGTMGTCLKRGTWHAHFSLGNWANFLMITRRSTTVDIESQMDGGDMQKLKETVRVDVAAPDGSGYKLHLA
jgi:ureidoglycolate lyase